jgi:dCMP deaminase
MRESFDMWALGLCGHVATRSKDPSTQVGAVIVRPDRTIAAVGYNGFPRGVDDEPERYAHRPTKLLMTVHAETNAILTAREPLHGCTIYVAPLHPCAACAGVIVQAGIARVVTPWSKAIRPAAWADSFRAAETMFREAGIVCEAV